MNWTREKWIYFWQLFAAAMVLPICMWIATYLGYL